jgi:HSP20 family molecular chaperone IbpA
MSQAPRPIPVRRDGRSPEPLGRPAGLPAASPPIDIREEAGALVLEADVPGVAEATLRVEVSGHVLTLRGRAEPEVPEGARALLVEFPPRELARSFILSNEFDPDRIRAELVEGVLRLTLPRADRPPTRRIEVRTPGG